MNGSDNSQPATTATETASATACGPPSVTRGGEMPTVALPANGRVAYPTERLSIWLRCFNAFAGLAILVTFGIAVSLSPSPYGLGTHQQLGLPPCTTVALFGVRCPSCGMTTSWSLFVRGDWLAAVGVNAGGFLLALIALAYLPASCYLSMRGQASRGGWLSLSLAIALVTALSVAMLQWGWRLISE